MSAELGIGEVARRVGVRPSAVRYYEERGLIAPDSRRGGKRVYGKEAIERMVLILFAKEAGFRLDEIRELIDGFSADTPMGARWSKMAAEKLEELDAMAERIDVMRSALQRISQCGCESVTECSHCIASKKSE